MPSLELFPTLLLLLCDAYVFVVFLPTSSAVLSTTLQRNITELSTDHAHFSAYGTTVINSNSSSSGNGNANNSNNFNYKKDSDEQEQQHSGLSYPAYSTSSAQQSAGYLDYFNCCNLESWQCRKACKNIDLTQYGHRGDSSRNLRSNLRKHCSSIQSEFWSCVNQTLNAIQRGSHWSGRRCCNLGLAPRCRNACATVPTTKHLHEFCRQSDEQRMFECFKRQEHGDYCCNKARNPDCLQTCNDFYEPQNLPKKTSLQNLKQKCGERNEDVFECVRSSTDVMPQAFAQKLLPCCDYSESENCRKNCAFILNNTQDESTDIIFDELKKADCGEPLPRLPLWQCFMTIERKAYVPAAAAARSKNDKRQSQINEIGIDAAKLQCCEKANSSKCRRACAQTYKNAWSSSVTAFENECRMKPDELKLRQCLDDVDEPCALGCDGLSFCANFNNRPTELFRSCTRETDAAARADLSLWQQYGNVTLPGVILPIKNMTRCAPEKWKAIACALQLKPCTRHGHYTHICREDCYEILSECMDWTRMNSTLQPDAICARLHPTENGYELPCVSLRAFLEASDVPKDTGGHHGLTAICKGNRCKHDETCVPKRRLNIAQKLKHSLPYQCVPGCSLGEGSNYWVPFGAFVRIPVISALNERNWLEPGGAAVGFKVCRCGAQNRIEDCQPLPSFSYEHCIGGYQHGTIFNLECNVCSCFAGETTCTKKQCRLPGITDNAYTSLPCNCPTHYVPVCGSNGNTYHSACIAKCLGLQDSEIEYGACSILNPCQSGKFICPAGTRCIERRRVCLSAMQRPCPQYQCVNETAICAKETEASGFITPNAYVCDEQGITYATACDLLNAKASLAYWAPCQTQCANERNGPVCGINGVTYRSECAAWADFVLVDYHSRCREVGLLSSEMGRRCRTVVCPNLRSRYCRLIVPPGACCPICGGAFRVIYSRKQIERAMYALRGQIKDSRGQFTNLLTLQSVLGALDGLIEYQECQLTGYLSMEVGLFVAVVPHASIKPTRIQIEACIREAEKISTLVSTQSHLITTNLVLSGLTASFNIEESRNGGTVNVHLRTLENVILTLLISLLCVFFRS